ncbi:thermonuclease family protein [Mesorhizobium mediterraneum]|uniref:thermonuclease family protein n=1 Tax=Mesorhizobium mediterraneum TaxID=43617 RepID=UPI001FEF35AD|nr:thermonuclease family protein [Mesorhizobium mediterraneum]
MTVLRPVLLVIGIVAAGVGWVMLNDRLGRPERPAHEIEYLPMPRIYDDAPAGSFTLCAGPIRANCVVDGDTFWFRGEKVRIADIDAPEISQPRCPAERQAGEMARDRLQALLNEGRFSLTPGWRDEDRYGRKLRMVSRSGKSLGDRLVEEGLARHWDGPDLVWCDDTTSIVGGKRFHGQDVAR